MYAQIVAGPIPECPSFVSLTARDLIHQLLVRDPQRRLSDEQLRQHAFFGGIDWDRLERLEYPTPYVPGLVGERADECVSADESDILGVAVRHDGL